MNDHDFKSRRALPVRLKICGMGTPENIREIASLEPDYLGFIFYQGSPRNYTDTMPGISEGIIKTGVFVEASEDFILEKIRQCELGAIQLHGGENAEFCRKIRTTLRDSTSIQEIKIIKVFPVKDDFDFNTLNEFEGIVDYFLFDTKGKNKGGNGITFNWDILKNYNASIPFFLSGGIGMEEVESINTLSEFFENNGKSDLFYGIDVNSKFEDSPGKKNKIMLEKFQMELIKKGLK